MNKLRKSNRRKSQKYRKNWSENNLLTIVEALPKHKKLLKNNNHNKPAVNVPREAKQAKAQRPLIEERLPKHKRRKRSIGSPWHQRWARSWSHNQVCVANEDVQALP